MRVRHLFDPENVKFTLDKFASNLTERIVINFSFSTRSTIWTGLRILYGKNVAYRAKIQAPHNFFNFFKQNEHFSSLFVGKSKKCK